MSALPMRIGGLSPTARATLRDMAVALTMLLGLRVAWEHLGGPDGLTGAALHPFWIVVVLGAAQGGLSVGVATAGMATALTDWPERAVGSGILDHYAQMAETPLMWLLTAIVLGTYRRRQIAIEDGLRAQALALEEDNETLSAEIGRLDDAVRRMELAAMTRLSAGDHAIAALAGLGRSDATGRATATATAAALLTQQPGYVLRHDQGDPVLHWGFPGDYVPRDPGGAPDGGPLERRVAGYSHAARQDFAGGEVVILAESAEAARAELAAAAVLAHSYARSLLLDPPAARLIAAVR